MDSTDGTTDGWREGSVKIKMPAEDKTKRARGETKAPELEVKGVRYRPFIDLLRRRVPTGLRTTPSTTTARRRGRNLLLKS